MLAVPNRLWATQYRLKPAQDNVNEYLLLMHDDVTNPQIASDNQRWESYFESLHQSGRFDGGSSIGPGISLRKQSPEAPLTPINGFIRVRAESLLDAQQFIKENPIFEAGGTIEIRELLKD